MTERVNRGLSLLAMTLAIGIATAPIPARALQDDAPAKKAGKKGGKRAEKLPTFQTGLLIRMAIGVNSVVKVGESVDQYRAASKLLANANRVCTRVMNSDAAPNVKKKRLLAAHQTALKGIKAVLPEAAWAKFVAAGDQPKPGELILKVKALKLCPLDDPWGKTSNLGVGDDPFGKTNNLSVGDDPFGNFIGETEKNLLRSAPLGGDRIIADTPF